MNQGLSIKQWVFELRSRPLELVVGLLIFVAASAGGAVTSAASTSFAILFIISLFYVRSWPSLWRQLTSAERLVLFGFVLYFLSAVLAYYNVNDERLYLRHLDRYARFLLVVPVYLLLSKEKFKLFPFLLAGAIVSGPLYLGAALISIAENPGAPAKWMYHHITFGDMAMLGALFMTTVLVLMKTGKTMKVVLVVSIICLLYASLLSQARGAWLALPFGLFLLLFVAIRHGKIKVRTIFIALLMLGAVIAAMPAKDIVSSRIQKAVHEIALFQSGENAGSSVGSRLAMWHVAINVWKAHPIIGTGPGDYRLEFEASQERGLYKGVNLHTTPHNIFFLALATIGTIGFIVLCLTLFILPFWLFYKTSREKLNVASVSGMVVLTAFAVFGLTESWTLRSPPLSVYLLYFVVLATTASTISSGGKANE